MLHAQYPGTQASSDVRQGCQGSQGRTGNLEQNLGCGWDRATDRYQHSTGGNIEGGSEFQEFLVSFGTASDKNRNCQGQARETSTLCSWSPAVYAHTHPFLGCLPEHSKHLRGQIVLERAGPPTKPSEQRP